MEDLKVEFSRHGRPLRFKVTQRYGS